MDQFLHDQLLLGNIAAVPDIHLLLHQPVSGLVRKIQMEGIRLIRTGGGSCILHKIILIHQPDDIPVAVPEGFGINREHDPVYPFDPEKRLHHCSTHELFFQFLYLQILTAEIDGEDASFQTASKNLDIIRDRRSVLNLLGRFLKLFQNAFRSSQSVFLIDIIGDLDQTGPFCVQTVNI